MGPTAKGQPALQVLVAETSRFNQLLAEALLSKLGHRATVAGTGPEAVRLAVAAPVDVILIDPNLPDMQGLEGVRAVRSAAASNGQNVRVLAMTCEPGEAAGSAAINGTIDRPLDLDRLTAALSPAPELVPGEIDWERAAQLLDGRDELLRELVEIFLSEYEGMLARLDDALEAGKARDVQVHAHGIKGSLRYFGTTAAATIAAQLEEFGRDAQLENAAALHPKLKPAVEGLVPQMRSFLQG